MRHPVRRGRLLGALALVLGAGCLGAPFVAGDAGSTCPNAAEMMCSGTCIDVQTAPENCGKCGMTCEDAQACTNGRCICRPGLLACNGACVDTASDPENCGKCGITCTAGQSCVAGECVTAPCPPTYTDCGNGSCVLTTSLMGNPIDCGGCNIVCAPDEVCTQTGLCVKYFASPACTTCPCAACGAAHKCCEMGGVPLCVLGEVCGF